MRLTSFTDYSVRVLIYAAKKDGELTSIREVSEAYEISSNHLMKVVHLLGKGGYLHTVRGKNGGFKLGKEPKDINIGAVIRYTEDDLNIVENLSSSENDYALEEEGRFADVIGEALQSFLMTLDNYTLEDLLVSKVTMKF